MIGDPAAPICKVRVASIRGDRVRIAFDAPKSVPVHRSEVADQITGKKLTEGGAAHA